MGGWGSGRRRTTVYLDHLPQLRLRDLADRWDDVLDGLVDDPQHHARITFYLGDTTAAIVPVAQPLGGIRMWFLCDCGQRCGVLYERRSAWMCRRCTGLPYASQNVGDTNRLRRQAFKLYARINADYRVAPRQFGPKPKGMRWRTYWTLRDRAERLDTAALLGTAGVRHLLRDR